MKVKVLIESSVLVAASTLGVSQELLSTQGEPLKHPFFDQAMGLFGIIRKNLAKRIGVITALIEDESASVLHKAVLKEIEKRVKDRRRSFQILSATLNSCQDRMRELTHQLVREPIDIDSESKWFVKVCDMYNDLIDQANQVNPQDQAYQRASVASTGFRRTAYEIYKKQEEINILQLMRLIYDPPSETDERILAQAILLFNFYKQTIGTDVLFILASTDTHFSPVRVKGGQASTVITDEIEKRFGVVCDWPYQIIERLREHNIY